MNPAAIGGILSGAGSIASGLGLGGGKFKAWHGRENARNEWFNLSGDLESKNYYDAVRRGADQAGINVITALGGAPSVGSAAGTFTGPKLGAMSAVIEGFKGISDEFTGVASQQRAARELQLDLARVELDNAKAAQGAHISAQPARSQGGPQMGSRANKIVGAIDPKNTNPIAGNREKEIMPLNNSGGVFEMENKLTYGPVTIAGDSEPWGLDELGTAVIMGAPQAYANMIRRAASAKQPANTLSARDTWREMRRAVGF